LHSEFQVGPLTQKRRFKPVVRRESRVRRHAATGVVVLLGAIGFVQFGAPGMALGRPDSAAVTAEEPGLAAPSSNAFGRSGEVKLLFTMRGERITFPLAVGGDPSRLSYAWTSLLGDETAFAPQPFAGAELAVPQEAGFYYLTIVNGKDRQVVKEPLVAVMRPFGDKAGSMLDGYKIGTYLAERLRGGRDKERPEGFIKVYPQFLDIPVSKHLRLHHFITHDEQADVWPKYVALNPRLLDKLELVFAELERMQGTSPQPLELDVNSGYRTPAHNKAVRRAASDSRHQYGDAADVVVDANGNGRIDRTDHRLVAAAVETVERRHPDLVGGLGVYTSTLYPTPYVHIDARGQRVRWRG
jgi:uncharacterized protein YcbK (DUF882 family)